MRRSFCIQACALLMGGAVLAAETDVIPRPQFEAVGAGYVVLARQADVVRVRWGGPAGVPQTLTEGINLLRRRTAALGAEARTVAEDPATVVFDRCDTEAFLSLCRDHDVPDTPDGACRGQAYALSARDGRARIQATGDLALYYGAVTLCQLMRRDEEGNVVMPVVDCLDWPAIPDRLSKTSATRADQASLLRAMTWLPLFKINRIGLQYHGNHSKAPEAPFPANIETVCAEARRRDVIRTVVYFCPFKGARGKAYDFSQEADRAAYAAYLESILDQGADGLEVDYNDWPGSLNVPYADVLGLAAGVIRRKRPDALLLWCPPLRGKVAYRYMATPELAAVLAKAPPTVRPLWTGMQTLIERPLTEAQLEQWASVAGRRPFLWVNRASLDQAMSFSHPVKGEADARVFYGERLPRSLSRLVEGVHLNSGFGQGPGTLVSANVAYLATAADFLWNPRDWDAAGSARRARHFVQIMEPLIEPREAASGTGP